MASQKTLTNHLKSLSELEHVKVSVTPEGGTVRIEHQKHHALSFVFKWSTDHFIGYFVDGEERQSQAVVSLYTPLDATHFSSAFTLLAGMRAKQKS